MYDVVVVGGGPAGYVCAIRAAQNNLAVACIDDKPRLGGTCLNVGCIPSKFMLDLSHKYHSALSLGKSGIEFSNPKIDLFKVMEKKETQINTLSSGIDSLFKKNKVHRIKGKASFVDQNSILVNGELIKSKNFVIATGSVHNSIPGIEIDEKIVVSSTGCLSFEKIPDSLIVVGGGYIGLEMACVWSRLGSKVTVIESANRIVPSSDEEISKMLFKILTAQGINIVLNAKIAEFKKTIKVLEAHTIDLLSSKTEIIKGERVLIAAGRKPFIADLNLEKLNIKTNDRGFVIADDKYRTSKNNIYAIGDVIGGMMLAHKGEEEGIAVADIIAGKRGHVNYSIIPSVIYTHPEVAAVGKTEEELKKEGAEYSVGKFHMLGNSRAQAIGDAQGMVKILSCKKTDRVLGAHIIAPEAGSMIHQISTVMEFSGSSEDIALSCHAHPTFNEAIKEACMMITGKAIHA